MNTLTNEQGITFPTIDQIGSRDENIGVCSAYIKQNKLLRKFKLSEAQYAKLLTILNQTPDVLLIENFDYLYNDCYSFSELVIAIQKIRVKNKAPNLIHTNNRMKKAMML